MMARAQEQLRWVLGKTGQGQMMSRIAQLRLARVMAAAGGRSRLAILEQGDEGRLQGVLYAIAGVMFCLGQGAPRRHGSPGAALALAAGDGLADRPGGGAAEIAGTEPRPVRVTVAAGLLSAKRTRR